MYQASIKEMYAKICWVSGHSGVTGKENSDTSAKSAAINVDKQATARPCDWSNKGCCQKNNGKDVGHPQIIREIKPEIEIWKSSFNNSK